jgi:parallel beta-helix repeat protein
LKNGSYGNFSFINSPARTAWLTWKSKDDPVFNKVLISNSNKRNAYMKFEGLTIHPPQPNPMPPDDGYRHIIGNVFDISRADNVQVNNCTLIGYNKYLTEYAFNVQESINVTLYGNDASNTLGGFYIKSSNKTKIINNYLHDVAEGSGIRILERNFYTLIEGNHVYGQDGGPNEAYFPHYGDWHVGSGMSIRSDNMIIRNNTVHNGYSQGLMFYSDGLPVYNNIILENNLFYDTGKVALYNCGKNISIIHNTFIGFVNVEGAGQTRVIQRYTGGGAALNIYNAAGYDYSGISMLNNLQITTPTIYLLNKANNFIWTSELVYMGQNDSRAIWINSSNYLHGNPNIFEDVGFRGATSEYNYTQDGIKPFFVNAGFYTQSIEWGNGTNYSVGYPVRYRPNGKYYQSLQNSNINNSPIDSPSWWLENDSLSFWEKDMGRSDLDYHPLIDSVICNGSMPSSVIGEPWAGALPCVCTNNSQCEEVYGTGATCDIETRKCEGGLPAQSFSTDIFVELWGWIKDLLTGNTIKEITGYFLRL